MSVTLRIFLIALTTFTALGIGLYLRRLLVRRLKNTILDNWLVQTIGIFLIFPPLALAAVAGPIIWDNNLIGSIWAFILSQIPIRDATSFVWGFIETLLIIVLGIGFARTIMKVIIRGLGENRIDVNIRTLIGRIFYIIIVIIIIFWILSIWQISIGLPVALIGTLTVALAFAIQDILKDLVAGFYILMERPFHIGDQITIGDPTNPVGHTGRVEDIQIRATRLRLVSGEELMVPNALVFNGIVTNNSYYGERRATLIVTLPQAEYNKDETPDQILKTLKAIENVMVKPEPTVLLSGYSETKFTLRVRFWIASGQIATVSDVVYALRTVLPNADVVVLETAGDM